MSRRPPRLLALAAAALLLASCSDDAATDDAATDPAGGATEGSITVAAAASLTEAFTEIGDQFTRANPDTEVAFTFDSSSSLATQIREGAPVDVFASADESNMEQLVDEGLVDGEPEVFARNELVIVTKPGNPEGIEGLADLVDAGVIALCGAEVPCGRFAQQVLAAAGVDLPEGSVTRGQNVKATLGAVAQGDAAAGIVYVTDAQAAGDAVDTVAIPADVNAVAVYPLGVLGAAGATDVAEAFVAFVLGERGQAVLEEQGFLPPG